MYRELYLIFCLGSTRRRDFFWLGGGACVHADNIVMNCVFLCKNLHLHQNPLMPWIAAPLMSCLGHISPIFQPILPLWLLIPAVKWTERNKGICPVSAWFTFGSSASASSAFSFSSASYSARGRVDNDSNLNLHSELFFLVFFYMPCFLHTTMFCLRSAYLWIKVRRVHTPAFPVCLHRKCRQWLVACLQSYHHVLGAHKDFWF